MLDKEGIEKSLQDINRKFGKCDICEKERMLWFSLGSYRGQLWCGWVCPDCIRMAQERDEQNTGEINNTVQ